MKRVVQFLSVSCVAALALTGCGGSGASSEGDGKEKVSSLELWMPPLANDNQDKALWQQILKPFEEDNNVKVNVTIVPWDSYETKFLTGIQSGKGPDVGYMYNEMIGDYIVKDQLIDMSSMVTSEQKDNLFFLDKGKFDGKQYSMPIVVGGARMLFYNKDLLKQANVEPPKTWEELASAGEKVKAAGIKPMIAPWGDPSRGVMNGQYFPFVWQAGGDLFSKDGKKAEFDSPENLKAAKYIMELKGKGILPEDTTGSTMESTKKEFASGKVAFYIADDNSMKEFDAAKLNYGYIPSLKDKQEGTFVASDSLTMLKQCRNHEMCYKLISFMVKGSSMEQFHKQANFPPIGKDENSNYPKELLELYTKHADILHALPIIPNGTGTYQMLYTRLQKMLNGQLTPEQALKEAAAEANQALSAK